MAEKSRHNYRVEPQDDGFHAAGETFAGRLVLNTAGIDATARGSESMR